MRRSEAPETKALLASDWDPAAGKDAGYLGESSSKYLNHLKVALTSIRKSCPSIVPIVVVINNISADTKRWITALGATVVKHDLTISKHVYKTAALEEWSWIKGVISTYLRIEVAHSECAAHSHCICRRFTSPM